MKNKDINRRLHEANDVIRLVDRYGLDPDGIYCRNNSKSKAVLKRRKRNKNKKTHR